MVGVLDFLDRADIVIPILTADEWRWVDWKSIIDVDSPANTTAFLGPPDSVLEALVGELITLTFHGRGLGSLGLTDNPMFKVPHVVRTHHDTLVHALQESNVVFKTAHNALFAGAVGKASRSIHRHLNFVTLAYAQSLAGVGMHEDRIGVDDFSRILPVSGTALRVNIPLKG